MKTTTLSGFKLLTLIFFGTALSFTVNAQRELNPSNVLVDSDIMEVMNPCNIPGVDRDQIYQVSDHTRPNVLNHSIWLNGFPCNNGTKTRFTFDETNVGYAYIDGEGNFVIDGIAEVTSGGQCGDANYLGTKWRVHFTFRPAEDEDGIVPKYEGGCNDSSDWVYYVMTDDPQTMVHLADESEVVTIFPMDNNYGLQVGNCANVKNEGLGMSTWFNFSVNLKSGSYESNNHGDINANLTPINCPEDPGEPCEDFVSFYAHNGSGNASSILYSVSFDEGTEEATFEELVDMGEQFGSGFRVHISFDENSNLLYAARNDGSVIVVYQYDGTDLNYLGELEPDLPGGIVQNVFFRGEIYLGSSSSDKLYAVNTADASVTEYCFDLGDGLNISGGDLAAKGGRLFSASRSNRNIYRLDFSGDPQLCGSATVINGGQGTPSKVNGYALSGAQNFLMTNDGKYEVYVLNDNGAVIGSYDTVRDDEPFKLLDGDLTTGCASRPEDPRDPCEDYKAFYASHNGSNVSDIFELSFVGGNAQLDKIVTVDYEAHLTLNTDDGYIYTVDADNAIIYKVNPNGGTTEGTFPLVAADENEPGINSIYCMAYRGGKVFLASAQRDKVYEVSFIGGDAVYTVIADNVPVEGGDLIHRDGKLFLATRSGNMLYQIVAGNAVPVNGIASKVNGIALNAVDNFITANFNSSVVYEYDENGAEVGQYPLTGDLTQFKNGDLASGCTDVDPDPLCDIAPIDNPGAESAQTAIDNNDPDFNNGWEQYDSGSEPAWLGWSTTTSIEIQQSEKVDGNKSFCGNFHFELLSKAVGDNMYQVVDTNPGATVYVSFYHKKRRINGANPADEMEVLAGPDLNSLNKLGATVATSGDDWVFIQRSFQATSAQTVVMLRGLSGTTVSIGNLIDNVYIGCEEQVEEEPCGDERPADLNPSNDIISEFIIDDSRVAIYPVPASTNLSIKVTNSGKEAYGKYYITSLEGRTSHQGMVDIRNGESSVINENVTSLPDGMYFLIMEINGRQITKQFVKVSQ